MTGYPKRQMVETFHAPNRPINDCSHLSESLGVFPAPV
ncbi:hypothetical protein MGWOODY_Tha1204 [hydrothermal vent metagenome]|uniref:Uncharacterized protein n=1 Tax=hydrothermal vent metagenome TaxID=652676 RepID=A0A160TAD3_9ZZZZ